MAQGPTGAGPQWSADRQWYWTGTEWIPAPAAPPPPPPQPQSPMPPQAVTAAPPAIPSAAALGGAAIISGQPRRGHTGRNIAIGCGGIIAFFVIVGIVIAALNPATSGTNSSPAAAVSSPSASATHQASSPSTKPAATPSAKPTTSPSSTPAGIAPIQLTGRGQSTPHFTVTDGLSVFQASCGCSGNFIIEVLDSSGNPVDIPVNVIGRYAGSFGEHFDAGSYILKIDSDAAWTVTITQPRNASGAGLPKSYTEKGQQIVGPFAAGGAINIAAKNTGSSNFIVAVIDQDGNKQDIPINEIGNYSGSTISSNLSNGPFYLDVDSNGSWTISVSNV